MAGFSAISGCQERIITQALELKIKLQNVAVPQYIVENF